MNDSNTTTTTTTNTTTTTSNTASPATRRNAAVAHDRPRRRLRVPAALTALGLLAVAGCGDDVAGSEATAAFCDAFAGFETSLTGIPWDGPDEFRDYFASNVSPRLDELDATSPDELSDEVATFVTGAREFGDTGDFASVENDEVQAAEQEINDHLFDGCPGERLDVVAIDFAFEDLPDAVAAGPIVVRFDNQGEEEHELIVVRRLPGTTEPVDELLAMPEAEVDTKIELVAGVAAAPGQQDVLVADLSEGDYIAVCFIPTGSTEGVEGDGPPHAMEGMVAEFEVT